ncbi:hypothetical protein EKO27_g3361 [Xylaria grammica]|uniref:Uncharacterized protein n=1 Tax=Xylaria grammica TaxID=363999 RepID=A0A439DBF7_9PEZI|nr:hypothetical protein EKO27_g3361 [Xylaria grammica]
MTSERRPPPWNYLPPEIRTMIVKEICSINGCKLAGPVIVSWKWQAVLEPQNFSRITLAPTRLRDLESMVHRNRSHMRYLWFLFELQRYSCAECDGNLDQLVITYQASSAPEVAEATTNSLFGRSRRKRTPEGATPVVSRGMSLHKEIRNRAKVGFGGFATSHGGCEGVAAARAMFGHVLTTIGNVLSQYNKRLPQS